MIGARGIQIIGLMGLVLLAALSGAAPRLRGVPEVPSDLWLTTTAKIAILTSIGTRGTVQVDTTNSTMTLYGKVGSEAERVEAERLARGVKGVGAVRSLLLVDPKGEGAAVAISDSELQSHVAVALIAANLKRQTSLDGSHVSVQSVAGGTVVLAGIASLAANLRAIETTKNVYGVRAVRSEIRSLDVAAVYRPRSLGK